MTHFIRTQRAFIRAFLVSALTATMLLCGLTACTSLPTGYSDFDRETDFSTFETFAFLPDNTLHVVSPNPVNPRLEPTMKEEVRKALTRKGYTFTADHEQADFLVGFSVGATPTARTTVFTGNTRQVYVVGQTQRAAVVTQESSEGGVVIDVFEQESGEKKWMGWAIQEITMGDIKRLQVTVNELVGVILGHFPPDV
jgi:hypothetical protein